MKSKTILIVIVLILALFLTASSPFSQSKQPTSVIELFGEVTPIMLLILLPGIVQCIKAWTSLVDKGAEILTFVLGFVLFFSYQTLAELFPDYLKWYAITLYSIIAPLSVMGYYKLADAFTQKIRGE